MLNVYDLRKGHANEETRILSGDVTDVTINRETNSPGWYTIELLLDTGYQVEISRGVAKEVTRIVEEAEGKRKKEKE